MELAWQAGPLLRRPLSSRGTAGRRKKVGSPRSHAPCRLCVSSQAQSPACPKSSHPSPPLSFMEGIAIRWEELRGWGDIAFLPVLSARPGA
jgi:hypothetical protein